MWSRSEGCSCFASPDSSPATETRGGALVLRCIAPPPSFQHRPVSEQHILFLTLPLNSRPPTSYPSSGFKHAGKRLVFGQAQSGHAGSKLRPGDHDPSAEPALSGSRPPRTPVPERLQPHSQGTDLGVLRVPNSGTVPAPHHRLGQSPHSPGHLGSPQSPHSLGHPQVRPVAPPPQRHLSSACQSARALSSQQLRASPVGSDTQAPATR